MTDKGNRTQLHSMHIPRALVAATSSSCGKTLITCGLLEVFKRKGLNPRAYKCGPDYIDPMFHRKVLGIESGNLDSYFSSPEDLRSILCSDGEGNVLIEGVMGIYDGISVCSIKGSCYEIASITDTPVILVMDASSSARTLISLLKGVLSDDDGRLIKGIILNRISRGFYQKIKPVLEEELKAAGFETVCLGGIPKIREISIESRHLGLIMPDEICDIREQIERVADEIEKNCDVDALCQLMGNADDLICRETVEDESYLNRVMSTTNCLNKSTHPVLAVAYDEAFCFYYKENLKLLKRKGFSIEFFSPLHDEKLPANASAILLGGGYPELYLKELSSNTSMLDSVRTAIEAGMPSLGECGGFMYLHRFVSDDQGEFYPLVGVIDAKCSYTGHLVRFGYMQIKSVARKDNDLRDALIGLKGHEFHYYDSTFNGTDCTAVKPVTGVTWDCMIADEKKLWGFPHFYYGSKNIIIDRFVHAAEEYGYERFQ